MFPEGCVDGCADNSAAVHAYYVRLPKACADALPKAQLLAEEGDAVRMITAPLSVQEMHSTAAQLRNENQAVFFAAVREA